MQRMQQQRMSLQDNWGVGAVELFCIVFVQKGSVLFTVTT